MCGGLWKTRRGHPFIGFCTHESGIPAYGKPPGAKSSRAQKKALHEASKGSGAKAPGGVWTTTQTWQLTVEDRVVIMAFHGFFSSSDMIAPPMGKTAAAAHGPRPMVGSIPCYGRYAPVAPRHGPSRLFRAASFPTAPGSRRESSGPLRCAMRYCAGPCWTSRISRYFNTPSTHDIQQSPSRYAPVAPRHGPSRLFRAASFPTAPSLRNFRWRWSWSSPAPGRSLPRLSRHRSWRSPPWRSLPWRFARSRSLSGPSRRLLC